MKFILIRACLLLSLSLLPITLSAVDCRAAAADRGASHAEAVGGIIRSLMEKHGIPGMAVAVTVDGERFFYNFGAQAKDESRPVTERTLFEIGSVSKTFTAALAAYAQVLGQLSLEGSVSASVPALSESAFDHVRLLDLAVHTSGGLPLQAPGTVSGDRQLLDFFKTWKPAHAAGTRRNYSNMSVGLLGLAAAKSLNEDFRQAVAEHLLAPLGMTHTFYEVPANAAGDYAQGYTAKNAPARLRPGPLWAEAYGLKSCSGDLLLWLEANMGLSAPDARLQQALAMTRQGYAAFDGVIQGMIWEQYPLPVRLDQLLAGNSIESLLGDTKAEFYSPPLPPQEDALINKTGSTNGFGSYVLFIPARKTGLVLLANKSYPNEARVEAAWRILEALGKAGQ